MKLSALPGAVPVSRRATARKLASNAPWYLRHGRDEALERGEGLQAGLREGLQAGMQAGLQAGLRAGLQAGRRSQACLPRRVFAATCMHFLDHNYSAIKYRALNNPQCRGRGGG